MNTLDMKTPDLAEGNIDKIAALFPEVVTEKEGEDGTPIRSIDFDLLRQALSTSLVEGADERYRLDWPGKRRSLLKANTPITKTLRPVQEESVDFDTTQNLFIEGDNFEALKILQESYLGKVKMIYIDPPYNTGKDFVYSDKHTMDEEEYIDLTGAEDEEGNRMFRENTRTNPRFHSDWLSMMYERLVIARDLLRDDGVIFISIDDNEVHNLRKVCDEIFGESNFVTEFVWQRKSSAKGVPPVNMLVRTHEYILCYSKSETYSFIGEKRSVDSFSNPDNDPRGPWRNTNIKSTVKSSVDAFEIIDPATGNTFKGAWAFSKKQLDEMIQAGQIIFPKKPEGQVRAKEYFNEFKNENTPVTSLLGLFDGQKITQDLISLMGEKYFDYPKSVQLLQYIIKTTLSEGIVLDFFSGSATTAHAVMQQNAEDGGNRKFIMVQLPEETPEDSEARKAGHKNIAELGRERIRRAAKKIKTDYADKLAERKTPLDTGFRTYRVDETNMKDVYYHPTELRQESLLDLADNIKEDRTSEDLLTQVMLDLGLTLDLPLEEREIDGNKVFVVADGALVACFDTALHDGVVDAIAALQPLKLVVRDATFGTGPDRDQKRTNLATRMKRLSPDTEITVL